MIRKVIGIYYSPAGGTKIMTEALARKIGAVLDDCSPLDVSVECYDMLREESNSITFNDETVAVIGMPVYVGKIPLPAAAAMRKIAGNGAMTLAIVSYGGRKYGNALFELKRLVEECGFKAIGAGAFMIMNSSPYKQRIARLLEYLYSDEGCILHGWGIEGEDYIINEEGKRDITEEIANKKSDGKYDLKRGIRALYSIINLPTFTTDGQPAFARFAPYFSSDSGIDERDKIIREDPVYNWHEDWKGTFYSDLSEMDIVIEGGTPAAQASAQAARIIKDHINNIIMAESEAKAIELYEQALKELEAYNISAWEEEINRQIHAKREKLNG